MLLTRQARQQSVSNPAVTLPIQTEHAGWDLEILHACIQKNFCATNKTNVCELRHGQNCLRLQVSLVRVLGHHANGRPRPLRVCAPRSPAARLGVVWGGTVARLRSCAPPCARASWCVGATASSVLRSHHTPRACTSTLYRLNIFYSIGALRSRVGCKLEYADPFKANPARALSLQP